MTRQTREVETMSTDIKPAGKMTNKERIQIFEKEALPHMDSLYRTALRLTRNEKDAEDLIQEAMLRAFKSFHQFTPGTNCKAWLFKIMTNLHINNYQKKSRRPAKLSFDEIEDFYLYNRIADTAATKGNTMNVEEEVLSGLLDSEVREAIEQLPYEFRITVILADIEGFKYQEIADILDCPIGTVRSRLSRGRRLLEKHLWDYAKNSSFFRDKCNNSCSEAVENLVEQAVQEVEENVSGLVKEQMKQCKVCCDRFEFEQRLTAMISRRNKEELVSPQIRSKIETRLKTLL